MEDIRVLQRTLTRSGDKTKKKATAKGIVRGMENRFCPCGVKLNCRQKKYCSHKCRWDYRAPKRTKRRMRKSNTNSKS